MAVRRQCNRYRTEPFGTDFDDVLKRAKRYYKNERFYISKFENVYTALLPSIGFKDPDNAVYFHKTNGRWVRE